MNVLWLVLALSSPFVAMDQQAPLATAGPATVADPADTKVYDLGHDITPPQLISSDRPTIQGEGCKEHQKGKVTLDVQIDASGNTEYVYFVKPLGNDLDQLALVIAEDNRFTPGIRNGVAVAVRESVEISLETCFELTTDESGKQVRALRLKSQPLQSFDKYRSVQFGQMLRGVSAPFPVFTPEAQFSDEAKNRRINGVCIVSLVVDAHGMPRNPRVVRSLGYGLDEEAIKAIQNYRFRPGLKENKPVAVMMSIEVIFRQ